MNLMAVLQNQAPLPHTTAIHGHQMHGQQQAPHIQSTSTMPNNVPSAQSLAQRKRREREAAQRSANQQLQTPISSQNMEPAAHNPVSSARSMGQRQCCAHEAAERLANQQLHTPAPTQNMEHGQNLGGAVPPQLAEHGQTTPSTPFFPNHYSFIK